MKDQILSDCFHHINSDIIFRKIFPRSKNNGASCCAKVSIFNRFFFFFFFLFPNTEIYSSSFGHLVFKLSTDQKVCFTTLAHVVARCAGTIVLEHRSSVRPRRCWDVF